jgi:polyhydroxyalkanoate synthesis repressor PhaR
MRLIKRYRNRRLYDTELKKAITMVDVRAYVLQDIDLKIIDNASGRDITIAVLSGIVGETAGDFKKSGIKIVNAIIKKGGLGAMDVLKKLTLASIGAVKMTREKVEEIFDEMVKRGEMTNDERSEAIKNFVERSTGSAGKLKEKVEEIGGKLSEKFSARFDGQISTLAEKIEKLSAKVANLEKKISK